MSSPAEHRKPNATAAQHAAAIEAALEARGLKPDDDFERRPSLADDVWLPERGARVVARAWVDPAFRARPLANGIAAVGELGIEMSRHHPRTP